MEKSSGFWSSEKNELLEINIGSIEVLYSRGIFSLPSDLYDLCEGNPSSNPVVYPSRICLWLFQHQLHQVITNDHNWLPPGNCISER